jgi:hypothetical protein
MAHPHQPYWLWTGGISVTAGVTLVGAALRLDSARSHFLFWTNGITIAAYAAFAVTLLCFICAIREIPFPFARKPVNSNDVKRRTRKDLPFRDQTGVGSTPNGHTQVNGERQSATGRLFVPDAPKDLIAIFKTHTSAQAHKLLEPYYDQWIRISGALGDVGEWTSGHSRVIFQSSSRDPAIVMMFKDQFVFDKRLSILRAGVRMTIIGQIERIDSAGVQITNCEIESIGG